MPKKSVSLPWSGSVIAQQPRTSGPPKRSISSGFCEIFASIPGKPSTPKLIASPESPQPCSSAMMQRSRACCTGVSPCSAARSGSVTSSRPSAWCFSKTSHRTESLAITSAGSASASSFSPAGRITSAANLWTVSWIARSSSDIPISISIIAISALLLSGQANIIAPFPRPQLRGAAPAFSNSVRLRLTAHTARPACDRHPSRQ